MERTPSTQQKQLASGPARKRSGRSPRLTQKELAHRNFLRLMGLFAVLDGAH